jgi:hypothetical protein
MRKTNNPRSLMSDQEPIPRSARLRAKALIHNATASQIRLSAAFLDATAAVGALAEAWRRQQEAAFLEMVVRFDEEIPQRRPAYAHRHRWPGRPKR